MNKFIWKTTFNIHNILNSNKYKRILIIGMGGGCDIFSAYAYFKYLSKIYNKIIFLFGNCIGLRDSITDNEQLCPYLYRISIHKSFTIETLSAKANHYGTTKLEESIPAQFAHEQKRNNIENENNIKNEFCGPFIFIVPIKKLSPEINNISFATHLNSYVLHESFNHLNIDLLVGIDNGGDSLTGGIDYESHPDLARDRQVLCAMESYNIPYIHLCFGPGCDGESQPLQLLNAVQQSSQMYLGHFMLDEHLINGMYDCTQYLGENRTPNIIWKAYNQMKNENGSGNSGNKENEVLMEINRGIKPRISRKWICAVWVLSSHKEIQFLSRSS